MASLKLSGFCFAVCVVLAVFLLLPSYSSALTSLSSHYTTREYQVPVGYWYCYTYHYTYCYDYWYWNYWYWDWYWYPYYYYGYYWNPWYGYYGYWGWCNSYPQTSCYYDYYYVTQTQQVCQDGWVGDLCNVPTCDPACTDGMVCVDLNTCGCAPDGSAVSCQMQPCSLTNNCYPGTCVNNECKCPPGFKGPNCVDFDHQPAITSCTVKVFARPTAGSLEVQVAEADCAAPGLTPQVTWINGPNLNKDSTVSNLGISRIEPIFTASYAYPSPMPSRPQAAFFIRDTPVRIGVVDGGFNITFNTTFTTRKIQCSIAHDNLVNPPNTATCDLPTTWDSLLVNTQVGHNKSMVVNMFAALGGKKTGDSTYTLNNVAYDFGDQPFNGAQVVVQSMLKFDLMPPSHCLLQQAGSITPGSNGRINCTLYPIYLDQDIRTNPVIKPLFPGWTDDGSGIRAFHIEVFYMQPDTSGEQLEPNGRPVTDSVADVTLKVNNYQFTAPTPGVYSIVVTAYDYANNSATARKIFNYMNEPSYSITTSPVFIREANEVTNYTFINSLTNPNQLTLVWTGRFQPHQLYRTVLSKRVRPLPITQSTMDDIYGTQFGQRSINNVGNLTGISSYTVRYLVDSDSGGLTALPKDTNTTATINGETATLTFSTPLRNGDTVVAWLTAIGSTGNQTTYQLNVGIDTTRPNISEAMFVINGVDEYTSRVVLQAYDMESGINSTTYNVTDKRSKSIVIANKVVPAVTRLHPNRKKRGTTGVPAICSTSDTTCYCTAYRQCFPYSQTIDIDGCNLDLYKGDQFNLILQYSVSNNAGLQVTGTLELGELSSVFCRKPDTSLTPGAIVGIVIGCIIGFILLVLLVILIVLIIIRIRQNKRPIPSRQEMRTYAGHVRNRFTMRKETHNEMYQAGPQVEASHSKQFSKNNNAYAEDDVYVDKEDLDSFKIPKKQIQLSETLADGRFAVVRRAFYLRMNNKDTVAAKALKNGFSQSDELLMSKKVSFMKNVPSHGNLVHFIGFVDESDGQGPIMILELCDYPLKDWLANLSDISTDDIELMLNFTLNIAQGVAHLHTHKIIHRRLAVRNVLIKQQVNGLVAKLIGFGPNAEDDKAESAGTGVSVPLKWMAPETLDTMNSSKPVYNEKTDAWSYGVTVWEIYSKGDAPYPDVKSGDIKSQVKRGLRLQCPRECPPELFSAAIKPCWNESPAHRPTFNAIVSHVQEFRSGSQRPQSGYYGTDEVRGQ